MNLMNVLVALAVLTLAAGCKDAQEVARLQQRAALSAQLQQADALRLQAAQSVEARRQAWASLAGEAQDARSRIEAYEQAVRAYMADHKMAVAALAAGAAGGLAALDDSGRITEDARQVGAMVGGAALLWAAFNLEEAVQVASELAKASDKVTTMKRQHAAIEQRVAAAALALEEAQGTLAQITQESTSVRGALAAL